MQIKSDIITIPKKELSTEYIESMLKHDILRWAIVDTNESELTISVAYSLGK